MKPPFDVAALLYRLKRLPPKGKAAEMIRAQIIQQYEPLIKGICEKFNRKKFLPANLRDFEDLQQAGRMGLLVAISRWRKPKGAVNPGACFTRYARLWALREIQLVISKNDVVHRARQEGMPAPIVRALDAFRAQHGREATGEDLGLPPNKIENWRRIPHCVPIEGGTRMHCRHVLHPVRLAFGQLLTDPAASPERAALEKEFTDSLAELSPREREALSLSAEGWSHEEVAEKAWLRVDEVSDLVEWFKEKMR